MFTSNQIFTGLLVLPTCRINNNANLCHFCFLNNFCKTQDKRYYSVDCNTILFVFNSFIQRSIKTVTHEPTVHDFQICYVKLQVSIFMSCIQVLYLICRLDHWENWNRSISIPMYMCTHTRMSVRDVHPHHWGWSDPPKIQYIQHTYELDTSHPYYDTIWFNVIRCNVKEYDAMQFSLV